jgi:hypothetical protein
MSKPVRLPRPDFIGTRNDSLGGCRLPLYALTATMIPAGIKDPGKTMCNRFGHNRGAVVE